MENPKCPDCRGGVELERKDGYSDHHVLDVAYYKCPKCRQEYCPEELEED